MGTMTGMREQRRGRTTRTILNATTAFVSLLAILACAQEATHIPGGTTTIAQATATPNLTVIYQGALTAPSNGWPNDGQHCFFANDGYHVKGTGVACPTTAVSASDLDLSIQVVQLTGPLSDQYGIEIRRDATGSPANYYAFDIDGRGHWAFFKCTTSSSQCTALVSKTDAADPALHQGLNAANTIEVRAVGAHFALFINGTPVGQANDSAFASGIIAPEIGGADECVFSRLTVTKPIA
jgi:hypothetical protein